MAVVIDPSVFTVHIVHVSGVIFEPEANRQKHNHGPFTNNLPRKRRQVMTVIVAAKSTMGPPKIIKIRSLFLTGSLHGSINDRFGGPN